PPSDFHLGLNAVRSIVLSASVFDCFAEQLDRDRQSLLNFWLHSIGVAVTAEELANHLNFPVPEDAYIAGLLHDMGKLVCYMQFPEKFQQVRHELEQQGTFCTKGATPLDIEQKILETDHIEIGRLLGERWNFPEIFAKVMWQHHQPVFETILPDMANLPKLIRFADLLCNTHSIGSSYFLPSGTHSHQQAHFALETMMLQHHLSANDIDELMDKVMERTKEVGNILGFWDEKEYHKLVGSANQRLGDLSFHLDYDNRILNESNRTLDASGSLSRQLRSGIPLADAATTIIAAVHQAFGKRRCLCMIRDTSNNFYTGQLYDGEAFNLLEIPTEPANLKQYRKGKKTDVIEAEAVKRLSRRIIDSDENKNLEAELIDMIADGEFMATFFTPSPHSHLHKLPVLGQLMVDFSDATPETEIPHELLKNFEIFTLSAGNGIERLLLEADLTRQNEEIARASRRMEESQRLLFHSHRLATVGRLAAGAAHEINNPLTIISLNIQILDRLLGKDKDDAVSERLQVIASQEERIAKIVQDLMSFARPTQPKLTADRIKDIMDRVLTVIGDRVSMTRIEVDNQLQEDTPQILVDPLQIEQVFMNLLINANHAMPDGGTITLRDKKTTDLVEIEIIDNGAGISRKNLSKIFDPFFTTKKEGEGTGLGLAVCHSIIEHNGGSMRVASKEGEGTTFTIALPQDKTTRLRALRQNLEQEVSETPKPNGKTRILVVDDEQAINQMLADSLRMEGYEADGVFDGVQAIQQLKDKSYKLVILDIRMPRKDGLEVLQFINEEYPDLPVLIITALASKEEIKNTVKLGAYACLKKPFRLDTVLETVKRGLSEADKKTSKRKNK
ncbi:MAG: HDOD domain-containing protein, partial [Desulfobulbaceae bacterium]|nr:HDOD domain-containing protein [Desulfobulbaceae bacterium]